MKANSESSWYHVAILLMLALPVICLVSTIAAAPVRTAADAASSPVSSGSADWSSAVMVLMAMAGVVWVVVSLNLRGRFGKPANRDGGEADYKRRFFQPVETDPLWQAAHTNMATTAEMSPIPGELAGKWINLNPHHPSPTPTNTPESGKPGKPHAAHTAHTEKAGER